jgi:DNA-binding NtrC family response regulator
VIPVHVPALNDRRDDVPLLVAHFLKIICEQHGKVLLDVTDDAMASLQSANWTGNIRELRNAVERLVILTPKGGSIDGALVQRFGRLSA